MFGRKLHLDVRATITIKRCYCWPASQFWPVSVSVFLSLQLHYIFIVVKPILSISDDKRVKQGSSVTFSCNITAANPSTSTVTWKSQTNKLIQHSNGVVTMSSVSVEQGGRYTCHANNSAGESQKPFTLTVGEYITNGTYYYFLPNISYFLSIARMANCV